MLKLPKKYEWYIGIDTGVNTGWAVWNSKQRKFLDIRTVAVHLAMHWAAVWSGVTDERGEKTVFFRVEDARLAVHGRQDDGYKARGAGSVMRDAKMWDDYLKRIGAEYEMVRPDPKITKLPEDLFSRTTGWMDKSSSHGRDAAMIVYGY